MFTKKKKKKKTERILQGGDVVDLEPALTCARAREVKQKTQTLTSFFFFVNIMSQESAPFFSFRGHNESGFGAHLGG